MQNVVIYARISSSLQDSRGFSIQQQLASCTQWANERGMDVVRVIKEVASAANNQPLLNEFIDQCRDLNRNGNMGQCPIFPLRPRKTKKEIHTTLLVFSPCRFSRTYKSAVSQLNDLLEYGVTVASTVTKTTDEFFIGVEQAETEHNVMKMRLCQSVKFRRENGGYIGTVPFGYRLKMRVSDKIKTLRVDKEEQLVVKFIADCRTEKTTEKHLSKILRQIQSKSTKSKPATSETRHETVEKCCVKFSHGSVIVDKLSFKNIAQLLNDFNIKRRGHRWTTYATTEAFRRHENSKIPVTDITTNQSTTEFKTNPVHLMKKTPVNSLKKTPVNSKWMDIASKKAPAVSELQSSTSTANSRCIVM